MEGELYEMNNNTTTTTITINGINGTRISGRERPTKIDSFAFTPIVSLNVRQRRAQAPKMRRPGIRVEKEAAEIESGAGHHLRGRLSGLTPTLTLIIN